jgi:hypothetical protein
VDEDDCLETWHFIQFVTSNFVRSWTATYFNCSKYVKLHWIPGKRDHINSPWRISSPRTKLLAARCECLHLIKIDCLALWLDESAHACTRSELRGASCEDWKTAFKPLNFDAKLRVKIIKTWCLHAYYTQGTSISPSHDGQNPPFKRVLSLPSWNILDNSNNVKSNF